jgi:hypothetical protein
LDDSLLDSASLGKRDFGFASASDNEDVGQSCGESVALGILDGDDGERPVVLLNVHEGTNSPTIVSLGDHNHGTQVEFEDIRHFVGRNIDLNTVVDLDIGVRVSESASIVGDGAGNLVGTNVHLIDTAELVLCLFSVNSVQDVTSLGIVHQAEAIVRLLHLHDVHETGGEVVVGADLSVNLDATLHADLHALLVSQGVLKALTKDHSDRQAFTELVGSSGRAGGPDTAHLSEVPMVWRMKALQVLFRSASPEN